MFTWHRDPEPDWVADLATLSPPTPQLSHLELWWEAGVPWAPAQRWVLYNLHPVNALERWRFEDLGAHLDAQHPCVCPWQWRANAVESHQCLRCNGYRTQGRTRIYRTFMDRGYYALPMWVIQGQSGGHPSVYSALEKQLLSEQGQSVQVPATGSLPYAGWDVRVHRKIQLVDVAGTAYASIRTAKGVHKAQMARAARVAMNRYLDRTMDAAQEAVSQGFVGSLPRDPSIKPIDGNAVAARYIETGVLAA